MDLQQAAEQYTAQSKGFNLESGVPSPQQGEAAMQQLVTLAAQSDLPANKRLQHLDAIVASVAELAPHSASVFNKLIVENPHQRDFAKTLELALAVMEKRSPETWKHVLNHTALTMLYYERQTGLDKSADPARSSQLLTLMIGAIGHDIGKVGLDPELLHKATRISPERLEAVSRQYQAQVPDYPEKLHDLMFLDEANRGRIIFGEQGAAASQGNGDLIRDIGKDLRRSESYWLDEAQRQRHNAIWERIQKHACDHVKDGWLSDAEQGALTLKQRGTVTREEMKIIESHDAMSEAFFKAAPVPEAIAGVRDIVSMDRFRREGQQQKSALAEVIHATDVFEALTADRCYRAAYSPEEAVHVMEGMAQEGKVNGAVVESLKANGTLPVYAAKGALQHSMDIIMKPVMPVRDPKWVSRVRDFNPARELSAMLPPHSGEVQTFNFR